VETRGEELPNPLPPRPRGVWEATRRLVKWSVDMERFLTGVTSGLVGKGSKSCLGRMVVSSVCGRSRVRTVFFGAANFVEDVEDVVEVVELGCSLSEEGGEGPKGSQLSKLLGGLFLVFDVRDSSEIGVILGMRERLLLRGTFCVLLDLTREVEFTGVREREEAE